MDPVFLGNIESLKMDSPDVHRINFGPESTGRAEGDFGSLEGDIITRNNQKVTVEGELNTLDEPIFDTIKRDLTAVGNKVYNAMLPMKNPNYLLVEWDLWGALFFATYIGLILQQMNYYNPDASQFPQIILIVCLGTAAVTYTHVVMLRTNTSIFQYISVLGYCLAPMAINVTITYLLDFLIGRVYWIRFLLFVGSTGWSVYTTSMILKHEEGPLNIPYHLAPIGLYYLIIALVILYHTGPPPNSVAPPAPVVVPNPTTTT
ncbi:protein YIPF6 homolog [Folsomia candida]|uniref:Protein YIPF6 n=1 Tax=Folsomia candida TaxID=158441 RepID=A0A226E5I1_FOLCA|nr:protein YIPF6 homolog [Folsomia candida]OXA52689.1 Protein YIPF6 [Folsomia candida]